MSTKPSAWVPARASIFSPLAATQTGIECVPVVSWAPSSESRRPCQVTGSPRHSNRSASMVSAIVASGAERWIPIGCSTMVPPATSVTKARPPLISSMVAIAAAVAAGWRV